MDKMPWSETGLPPVIGTSPRILVLGSFPGRQSLSKKKYYAHPQNQFWSIMEILFGIDRKIPYPRRLTLLADQGIALWDVIHSCSRRGSADSQIENPVFCDLEAFLVAYPSIRRIVLNGSAAGRYYRQLDMQEDIPAVVLPSTSPAHARLTLREKADRWAILRFSDS
jgi:hypoxanthine-DNA glycosylase